MCSITRIIQIKGSPMIGTVRNRNVLESENIFVQQLEGNFMEFVCVCVCVCVCVYIYIYIYDIKLHLKFDVM